MSRRAEDIETYSDSEFTETLKKIYQELTKDKTPSDKPFVQAVLSGGLPGAGKTTIAQITLKRESNSIFINIDSFREFHPHFRELQSRYGDGNVEKTQKFAAEMTSALVALLSAERYNLIIEGTLRTIETPLSSNRDLHSKGYFTELSVMAVNVEAAWDGTKLRYKAMKKAGKSARYTDREYFDRVVSALPQNLGIIYSLKAFDRITLYNREKECLYNSDRTPNLNPREMLEKVMFSTERPRDEAYVTSDTPSNGAMPLDGWKTEIAASREKSELAKPRSPAKQLDKKSKVER